MRNITPGTTKEEYLDFVKHLSTAPKKSSISSLLLPSRLKHYPESTARLSSDSQEETARLIDRALEKSTFSLQNGQLVGTISFNDPKSKHEAIVRHEKDTDTTSIWSKWIVDDDFSGVTVLYQFPEVEDVTVEYVISLVFCLILAINNACSLTKYFMPL